MTQRPTQERTLRLTADANLWISRLSKAEKLAVVANILCEFFPEDSVKEVSIPDPRHQNRILGYFRTFRAYYESVRPRDYDDSRATLDAQSLPILTREEIQRIANELCHPSDTANDES